MPPQGYPVKSRVILEHPASFKPCALNHLPEVQHIHGWPADRVQALQQQTAQALGVPVVFQDKLQSGGEGPEMVVIPAGAFDMGSNEGDNEKPVHRVSLPTFALGRFPVTVADYEKFSAVPEGNREGSNPVVKVSWEDCREYCAWLSRETSRAYRLPSEAEWEYACRAGAAGRWYWGDDEGDSDRHAWYDGNSGGKTHPVGEKLPNAFSLHDMSGNVWEWCEDVWHDDYQQSAPADGKAWIKGGDYRLHTIRGGSWAKYSNNIRCAIRNSYLSSSWGDGLGFRLALARVLPGS